MWRHSAEQQAGSRSRHRALVVFVGALLLSIALGLLLATLGREFGVPALVEIAGLANYPLVLLLLGAPLYGLVACAARILQSVIRRGPPQTESSITIAARECEAQPEAEFPTGDTRSTLLPGGQSLLSVAYTVGLFIALDALALQLPVSPGVLHAIIAEGAAVAGLIGVVFCSDGRIWSSIMCLGFGLGMTWLFGLMLRAVVGSLIQGNVAIALACLQPALGFLVMMFVFAALFRAVLGMKLPDEESEVS